jgi:hypothetical protein
MHHVRQQDLSFVGSSHEFVGAEQGDTDISVFLFHGKPGSGPGPHRHSYDEIQFIREGHGVWTVNRKTFGRRWRHLCNQGRRDPQLQGDRRFATDTNGRPPQSPVHPREPLIVRVSLVHLCCGGYPEFERWKPNHGCIGNPEEESR